MSEQELRKLIRETISSNVKLLRETISDEAFSDPTLDVKAWLFYYKHYSQIAEQAIASILKIAVNNQIPDAQKVDQILLEWKTTQRQLSSLVVPNLN